MSKRKVTWLVISLLILVVASVGTYFFSALTMFPKTYKTISQAEVALTEHAQRVDDILASNGLRTSAWEQSVDENNIELRTEVLLEHDGQLTIALLSRSNRYPEFYIGINGEKTKDCRDVLLVSSAYPWVWEIIDALGGGMLSFDEYESLCRKQQKEILNSIEEEMSYWEEADYYTTDKRYDLKRGLFTLGTTDCAMVAEYSSDEELTGCWYLDFSILMYLY